MYDINDLEIRKDCMFKKFDWDWSKSSCGVMLCTFDETIQLMPEVKPLLESITPHLQYQPDNYFVDIKVHMLMPNEYPCIPNWHQDFVPRDKNKKKLISDKTPTEMMYIWVSGPPYTEFKSIQGKVKTDLGHEWIVFNQNDVHRGIISEEHTWRCFIRLIPKSFVHPNTKNVGTLRRHSQVYIADPEHFRW